jgi:hypothetical protein
MARMDVTLADRVKRYAAAHRQPISVVLRDAVTLLMEEYPASTDPSGPHRLAAHEFLSDRYESSLDTLLGETDSAGLEELLSDTNEGVVETILSEETRGPDIMSDTKEGITDIVFDSHAESPAPRTVTSPRTRSRNTTDTKADPPMLSARKAAADNLSDRKAEDDILSDMKAARRTSPQHTGSRPRGDMRQRILTLLAAHPAGLNAEQIRAALQPEKSIGDTLQGMHRQGVITKRGSRREVRYFTP